MVRLKCVNGRAACLANGGLIAGEYYKVLLNVNPISDLYWIRSSSLSPTLDLLTTRELMYHFGEKEVFIATLSGGF